MTRWRSARSGSALVQGLRVIAPVMPFLAEHLWQALVADVAADAPDLGLPRGVARARARRTQALLDEVVELRTVVALGHQARSASG